MTSGRRRSAAVTSFESSIIRQLRFEEEYNKKHRQRLMEERRRQEEEELKAKVLEWDDQVLTAELLHTLTTCWEVSRTHILNFKVQIKLWNCFSFFFCVMLEHYEDTKVKEAHLRKKFARKR